MSELYVSAVQNKCKQISVLDFINFIWSHVLFSSLTVQKDGPNKGRQFYGCPKPRGEGCNFFQWADENAGIT